MSWFSPSSNTNNVLAPQGLLGFGLDLGVRTHPWFFQSQDGFLFMKLPLLFTRINRSEEEYTKIFSSING